MKYRIEYEGGCHCEIANDRDELLKKIKSSKSKTIKDIRKEYKSGVSDSVLEKYERYIIK